MDRQGRDRIGRLDEAAFLAAGVALATSLVTDQLGLWASPRVALLVEDGAKLLGVTAWATYFVVTTRDIASSLLTSVGSDPRDAGVEARGTADVG